MSKCISQHGEYSEHTLDDEYTCTLCSVLDEDAMRDELRNLRARLVSDLSRAPTLTNEQQDARDPEAENAVAQIVMAYGDGGWLPLDLRYGIAVEVLTRLRSLGFTRPSALDADREAEFRWHEANGPVIDDDRYMPVTTARRLAAVSAAAPDASRALPDGTYVLTVADGRSSVAPTAAAPDEREALSEQRLQFARECADPDWSLSVPEIAKAVIRDLLAEVERTRATLAARPAPVVSGEVDV